jgi:hypothetical protein
MPFEINLKVKGKILLWGPRNRWEDNIKIYLKEMECGCVNWTYVA